MTLSELPAMRVERIEKTDDGLSVHGQFDRLDGVREGGCFRLARTQYAWANLAIIDRASRSVVATDARDPHIAKLVVGQSYTWFDDYWQAPLIEAIADPTTSWSQFAFHPSDAAYFRQGQAAGWRKAGTPLPEGAVETHVKPGGWDHEHCDLC